MRSVQRDPQLSFQTEGRAARYRARALPGSAAQTRIRSLLRQKYGWRDRWVGLLVDGSASVAVRLEPSDEGSP